MNKPLLGLAMIVRDEEEALPRLLASVEGMVDVLTICDTGSTDSTPAIAAAAAGRIHRHKWGNYGTNLTKALASARGKSRWILRLDADMELRQWDGFDFRRWLSRPRIQPDFYSIQVSEGDGDTYWLPLLVRGDQPWRYVGKTHEYLDTDGRVWGGKLNGLTVVHHADGSNRKAKFMRDIELLRPDFRSGDPRAIFYTAQSHRDLGNIEQAALIYDMRARMNGFEEERWYAAYQAAKLRQDVEALIEVWRERPHRHEPLATAARIVAQQGHNDVLFLESL